ncbi:peptidase M10A and M12B matrixin and adamalysin [Knoellia flava]|uniref:peptidase M10A and M12B matrixin and adamalysin n=1 Tax=Knoellia flava TaxID=913969 RepID=UPI0012EC6701|nr:peptidase M10A and M12B matrixin and adamalysin [Knoellia flava]
MTLGPRRRRRDMLRRLAELDRLDASSPPFGSSAWRQPLPYAVAAPPRRRRGALLPLLVTIAVTAGLLWVRTTATEQVDHVATLLSASDTRPPASVDAAPSRLVPQPISPGGSGGFTFMAENALGPATHDPCRPLHLVVNGEAAPEGADAILRDAIGIVAPAAGLRVVVDGPTDERAREGRPAMDRSRYGDRWSPALVAWTTPSRDARLDGDTAGIAGPISVADATGHLRNVSGIVHLDGPAFTEILREPGGRQAAVAIVVHELVHLVGLGHVDDSAQLMHPSNEGQVGLGDGDRRGLARLADTSCARGI